MNCLATPPLSSSSHFCADQNTNCLAFCEEHKLHHPKVINDGTVIVFPAQFTPPIPVEDVVITNLTATLTGDFEKRTVTSLLGVLRQGL
jgi:hypothetical protein